MLNLVPRLVLWCTNLNMMHHTPFKIEWLTMYFRLIQIVYWGLKYWMVLSQTGGHTTCSNGKLLAWVIVNWRSPCGASPTTNASGDRPSLAVGGRCQSHVAIRKGSAVCFGSGVLGSSAWSLEWWWRRWSKSSESQETSSSSVRGIATPNPHPDPDQFLYWT